MRVFSTIEIFAYSQRQKSTQIVYQSVKEHTGRHPTRLTSPRFTTLAALRRSIILQHLSISSSLIFSFVRVSAAPPTHQPDPPQPLQLIAAAVAGRAFYCIPAPCQAPCSSFSKQGTKTGKQQPINSKPLFLLNLLSQQRLSVGRIIGPQIPLSKTFSHQQQRSFGIQSTVVFSA